MLLGNMATKDMHGLQIHAVYIFAGCAKDTMKLKKLVKS